MKRPLLRWIPVLVCLLFSSTLSGQAIDFIHHAVFAVGSQNRIHVYDNVIRQITQFQQTGNTNLLEVAAGDIDGDGIEELVAAHPATGINSGDGNISVYGDQNGGSRFPAFNFILPQNGRLATGDVDGDGRAEILAASPATGINSGDGNIRVYGDHTAASRFPSSSFILPQNGRLTTADVDGDGRDEVIVASPATGINSGDGNITIYGDHTASGRFPSFNFILPQNGRLTAGDVDGDGRDEIIVASPATGINSGDGNITIYGDHTAGSRFPAFGFILPENGQLAAGDIDGDGRDEVVAAQPSTGINSGDGDLRIYGGHAYLSLSQLGNSFKNAFGANARLAILSKTDTDLDGLLDSWETNGLDANNDGIIDLNLPAWGANPLHKDIFLELDYMQGQNPTRASIQALKFAFAAAPVSTGGKANPDGLPGINLWIDTGTLTDASGNLIGDNFGGGNLVPTSQICSLSSAFYAVKSANFNSNRVLIFRYALAGNPMGCNSGGQGELGGNDFLDLNHDPGTIMHELGHNLNLHHGGNSAVNCKPNYISVMTYDYQFGILQNNTNGGQDLNGDGTPDGAIIDFSPPRFANGGRGIAPLSTIIENNLNENLILDQTDTDNQIIFTNPGGAKTRTPLNQRIDWNSDGDLSDLGLSININNANTAGNPADCANNNTNEILSGYDDWANIAVNFAPFGDSQDAPLNPVEEREPTLQELEDHRESLAGGAPMEDDFSKRRYGFHVGMSAPLNKALDETSDANIYASFDYNYPLNDLYFLNLKAGIMQLTAEPASEQLHPRWYFLTANLELNLPRPGFLWKPYLSAGPGTYLAKDGSMNLGANAGFGFKGVVFQETQLDIGFDYHFITGEEVNNQLLALYLGFRFK